MKLMIGLTLRRSLPLSRLVPDRRLGHCVRLGQRASDRDPWLGLAALSSHQVDAEAGRGYRGSRWPAPEIMADCSSGRFKTGWLSAKQTGAVRVSATRQAERQGGPAHKK